MKKLMTIALAAMCAATAFAQNPDALKQIKKCKTYSEAQALVKQNESSMSAAENAQAYNKLVDLNFSQVSDAWSTMQTNQAMEQMGQTPKETVDKPTFYANLCQAMSDALVCDKYDVQPNDKGKVAPKFRKANSDRLSNFRIQLISAGQDAQAKEPADNKAAANYYGMYAKTGVSDLFKDAIAAQAKNNPKGVGDEYLSEVARVAALCSFQEKDPVSASQYADIVMTDPEKKQEGIQLKMYFMEQGVKTHEDSLNCVSELEKLYQQYPDDGNIFAQLAQWYNNMNMMDKQEQLIAQRLQTDPNNFAAWAMRGQNEMNAKKYDEAISDFKKACDCPVTDPKQTALAQFYVGYCYQAKATVDDTMKYDDQIALVKQGIPYLEKARELDPNREMANWGYTLYNSYYNVYGEKDPKTTALKAELGY